MKFRLVVAAFAAALGLAFAPHAFAMTMQCPANASIQAGPWPSGATYSVPYDGILTGVSGNDINALEAAGCDIVAVGGGPTLVAILRGANFNSTSDQPMSLLIPTGSNYQVTAVLVRNCSASLSAAAGEFYNTASKGGTAVAGSGTTQGYTTCTGGNTAALVSATAAQTEVVQTAAPILSLTTAQGGAATADVYLFGYIYP